jgi:hypothetical protein
VNLHLGAFVSAGNFHLGLTGRGEAQKQQNPQTK